MTQHQQDCSAKRAFLATEVLPNGRQRSGKARLGLSELKLLAREGTSNCRKQIDADKLQPFLHSLSCLPLAVSWLSSRRIFPKVRRFPLKQLGGFRAKRMSGM